MFYELAASTWGPEELDAIQRVIAVELQRTVGPLTMIVKSAHVYDYDASYMTSVLDTVAEETG